MAKRSLQPNSNAGKIRAVLDEQSHLSNAEVAELVGPCRHAFSTDDGDGWKTGILPASYVSQVRRKFGYPKPKTPSTAAHDAKAEPDPILSLPLEALDWL